jgi:hypothetical protein
MSAPGTTGVGDGDDGGAVPHETSTPIMTTLAARPRSRRVGLLLLEALLALVVLIFIVWWTMFHGRSKGEPPPHSTRGDDDKSP